MRTLHSRWTAALLAMSWSATVFAQATNPAAAPPSVVDLAAIIRLARDSSPRIAVEKQAIAGAQANRITAGAYPNPSLTYGRSRPHGGQATMFTGTLQQQVTLDIPLLIAGQRGARIARADADIEAARARVAAGSSTLAAEAGSLFTGLQAAEDSARIIESTRDELLRLTHIVKARGESGMASTFDLARMEVELATVETRLADARADIVERAGQLATLLGIRGWQPRAAKSLNTLALPVSTIAKPRDGVMTSPAVIAAQNEESAAKLGVDVAKSERWPVPSLSLGRAWTSEPFGSANYVGLSVELPLLDTRRGLQARAESDATAATLRRELAESETAAQLEQYAGIIRIREAALAEHDRKAGARLPGLRQMAEDAYRLGRGTVFDLLDATRSRAELQQTKVELLAALVDAQIRYLAASGNWAMLEKSAKQ